MVHLCWCCKHIGMHHSRQAPWAEVAELELWHLLSFWGGALCPLPLQLALVRHMEGFWLHLSNQIYQLLHRLTSYCWINYSPWATDLSCQALFITEDRCCSLYSHTLSLLKQWVTTNSSRAWWLCGSYPVLQQLYWKEFSLSLLQNVGLCGAKGSPEAQLGEGGELVFRGLLAILAVGIGATYLGMVLPYQALIKSTGIKWFPARCVWKWCKLELQNTVI